MRKTVILIAVVAVLLLGYLAYKKVQESQAKDEAKWNPTPRGELVEVDSKLEPTKPCTFLTREDIKAATGTDKVRVFPDGNLCGWNGPEYIIAVELLDPKAWELRKANPRRVQNFIDGLGDEAFSDGDSVVVRKGDVAFVVEMRRSR
jgi:hypothetical protein